MVALRWLICSEGKIDAVFVADELEPCYGSGSTDEDIIEYENKVVSVQYRASERTDIGFDDGERESIGIRKIRRDFLKFDFKNYRRATSVCARHYHE